LNTRSDDAPRTVLVTSATDGLGRATAILLAEHGYRVFAGGRNPEKLASLAQLARERKLPLEPLELDVANDASADRAIAEILRRAEPVSVLVNNAGIAIGAVLEEVSLADFRNVFETNVCGMLRMAQRVLPAMRKQRRGHIVNLSSISGKIAVPLMGTYSASKHAVEALSDSLRLELYPFGIHVILIEPGYIPTNMNRTAAELSSAYAKNAEHSPYRGIYQRFLNSWEKTRKGSRYRPEDCARVILGAIREPVPRARYVVTKEAKMGVIARRLLSDSAMDRSLRKRLDLDALRDSMEREAAK
jgi:NAD(P)-dependent dehydrogenase (short-subunit alcohol dehydrogenase family)